MLRSGFLGLLQLSLPALANRLARILVLSVLAACAAVAAPEQWRKVTVSNFTIVTPIDEKQAVNWASDFTQFIYALRATIPVNTAKLPPLTIVVFPDSRDFEPFRPLDSKGKPARSAGFLSRTDGWAIAGLLRVSPTTDSTTTARDPSTTKACTGISAVSVRRSRSG